MFKLKSIYKWSGLILIASTVFFSFPQQVAANAIKTVFIIVEENNGMDALRSAPYISSLLQQGAHAENFHVPPGLVPLSEPKYVWLEAGTQCFSDICFETDDDPGPGNSTNSTAHLVTLLKNAGVSWKAYQEDISGTDCPLNSSGQYLARHSGMLFFQDVYNAPNNYCRDHYRPYTEIYTDLQNNTVARYNFITPNSCHDMHDCSISQGDAWLSTEIPKIMNSAAYKNGGAIFITADEQDGGQTVTIPMIILSPYAKVGYSNQIYYSHSSTLRTMEEIFGVSPFLADAANATDLSDLFIPGTFSSSTVPTPTSTPTPTQKITPTPTQRLTPSPTQQSSANVNVTVNLNAPNMVSKLDLGVSHTQYAIDQGNSSAVISAKNLVKSTSKYQNIHLMGWGTDNPNPSPGQYDWSTLDSRIALARSLGIPVITLCCSPDWMKGGQPGQTDWNQLEVAPLPSHYQDFANLAKMVAQRYPDVMYYQVWNEMKGFWSDSLNNWDYTSYTQLYNLVYDALKSVNPAIKVGGPYLVIEGTGSSKGGWASEPPIRARQWDVINYWLQNKHGADFLSIDRSLPDSNDNNSYTVDELMNYIHYFGDVPKQIASKTNLPIWWSEYYVPGNEGTDQQVAVHAYALEQMVLGSVSTALLWNPMQGETNNYLVTNTNLSDGGQAVANYYMFKMFHDYFGPQTQLYQTTSSSTTIEALASNQKTLLINKSGSSQSVSVNTQTVVTLKPYDVQLINTPNGTSNCIKSSGDANCDGIVDLVDFEIWREGFLDIVQSLGADFNGDQTVDLIDFEIWRNTFFNQK